MATTRSDHGAGSRRLTRSTPIARDRRPSRAKIFCGASRRLAKTEALSTRSRANEREREARILSRDAELWIVEKVLRRSSARRRARAFGESAHVRCAAVSSAPSSRPAPSQPAPRDARRGQPMPPNRATARRTDPSSICFTSVSPRPCGPRSPRRGRWAGALMQPGEPLLAPRRPRGARAAGPARGAPWAQGLPCDGPPDHGLGSRRFACYDAHSLDPGHPRPHLCRTTTATVLIQA